MTLATYHVNKHPYRPSVGYTIPACMSLASLWTSGAKFIGQFQEAPSWASSLRKTGSTPGTGKSWAGFNSDTLEKGRGSPLVCK